MYFISHLTRRHVLAGLAASAVLPALAQQSVAAFRPTRPVKLISPQQAGGSTDAIVRPIALKLGELWGQPVVVENKPGGGTIVATQAVVQAPADGHTIGLVIGNLVINPSLRSDLPYDTLKDIAPVIQIGTTTVALVAHPSLGVNNLAEFIQLAKARPGTISWASLGIGTGGHITGELLRKRAGIDIVHVPFSGSSSAYRELLPGRVQAAFVVLESAVPHVQAGSLKLLAVADHRRNHQGLELRRHLRLHRAGRYAARDAEGDARRRAEGVVRSRDPAAAGPPVDGGARAAARGIRGGDPARDRTLAPRRRGVGGANQLKELSSTSRSRHPRGGDFRHPREGGDPRRPISMRKHWIPAFAGMTGPSSSSPRRRHSSSPRRRHFEVPPRSRKLMASQLRSDP